MMLLKLTLETLTFSLSLTDRLSAFTSLVYRVDAYFALFMLLLEALYLHEIALDIPPHRLLLLFHFFELLLCTFSLRGALH